MICSDPNCRTRLSAQTECVIKTANQRAVAYGQSLNVRAAQLSDLRKQNQQLRLQMGLSPL